MTASPCIALTQRGSTRVRRSISSLGFRPISSASSAEGFLRSPQARNPFLLYVAFTAPHDPRTPPPEHRVEAASITLPANALPVHPFDNGEMIVRDELLEAFPRHPDAVRGHIADYYGMIAHLDSGIGSILATLDEVGLTDDTVVMYMADHGLALGQHGLMGKQNLYEHSTHVPLIMKGPGIPAGPRVPHLVWHADTTATLLEIAGHPADPQSEGSNLLPLARGGAGAIRTTFAAAYRLSQRMVRDERFKLIRYFPQGDPRTSAPTPAGLPMRGSLTEQLFDLWSDPGETQNLAFLPEMKDVRDRLLSDLASWQIGVGDPLASVPLADAP